MKEFMDKNDLIVAVEKNKERRNKDRQIGAVTKGYLMALDDMLDIVIPCIPTVNTVKLVRCKDCKHWNKKDVSGEYPDKIKCMCIAIKHQSPYGWTGYTASDDYCSFAERVKEK